MFISDYEALKFHEERSADLIHEANRDRLVAKIYRRSSDSRPKYLEMMIVLGSLLITWGEKLKNLS